MEDRIRPGDDRLERRAVADVELMKMERRIRARALEIRKPPGGEVVDRLDGDPLGQQAVGQMTADETGGTGDDGTSHGRSLTSGSHTPISP